MKLAILNTSVVVLAQDHNPTILHPAFLSKQQIVPEVEKLQAPPICTPAISVVKYSNGLVFMVETNKLQVTDNAPGADHGAARPPRLATQYIEALPHVRYTAVGINFTGFAERQKPEVWLRERFLKPGPWTSSPLTPTSAALRFVYALSGWSLNLSLDTGSIISPPAKESTQGIILSANYHTDLQGEDPLREATEAVSAFSQHLSHFLETASIVLALEE